MNSEKITCVTSRLLKTVFSPDSLMAQLNNVFEKYYPDSRWDSAQEIISSDRNSADFVRWILNDEDYMEVTHASPLYEFSKGVHNILSCLSGSEKREDHANKLLRGV